MKGRGTLLRMSTARARTDQEHTDNAAETFKLTPEEIEELDQADAEAEEDDRNGRLVPIRDFLALLRRA